LDKNPMSLTLYGLAQCSTCAKARAWLDQQAVEHQFINYRAQPLAPADLKNWAQALGGFEKLVNRASMTWRQLAEALKDPQTEAQWLELIAQYPALIRRPLAIYVDGSVTVGFNEKRYADKLGTA
jgi:Spx/MgsR family transcriptional regulator